MNGRILWRPRFRCFSIGTFYVLLNLRRHRDWAGARPPNVSGNQHHPKDMDFIQAHFLKFIAGFLVLSFFIKVITFSDRVKLDGISGEVYGIMFGPSTKYSTGYSDKAFLKIKPGMTEKEVLEILGEPVGRFKPYSYEVDSVFNTGLRYAKGATGDSHYRLRLIYLRKGIVTERRSEFWYQD